MIADDVSAARVFNDRVARVCLHALLNINGLLDVGFDTNIRDCDMPGVRDTIAELRDLITCCGQEDWLRSPPFVEETLCPRSS